MDTLSRDSSSSGSILPLVGVIAGGFALILSVVALVKLNSIQKSVAAQGDELAKISTLEAEVRAAATAASESKNAVSGLRSGIQTALDQVGNSLTAQADRLTKVEEAQKARPVAPAPKAGGTASTGGAAAAAPTGVVDAQGNYTIASGDNLSKIARKFSVRVDAIEAENPGLNPQRLIVGSKIKIPGR